MMAARTLVEIADAIRSGRSGRNSSLDELISVFDRNSRGTDLARLEDKAYHGIFESLFHCAVAEKRNFLGSRRDLKARATTTLGKCASALRAVVTVAAPKLKVKTTQAIVDHITQTLPSRDGDYVEPLFKEYIKALGGLLSHQNLVELLAAADGDSWFACVRFALECIAKQSGGVKDSSSASRASPAPGSGQSTSFGHSAGRPGTNLVLLSTGTVEKATLTDLLQVVLSLMTPPNAPVLGVSGDVASNVVQVLQQRHLGIGQVHQVAFAILNRILSTVSANDTSLALDFSRDLIPLLRFWWQARSVKDDAMLNSVRSEILKAMFIIHPHVAALTRWSPENPVLQDVEDLLDLLWNEYSNRDAKTKLQLDDLTFATDELPELSFRMRLFGLRPFDMDAERKWAMIQAIALFETVVWTKGTLSAPVAEVDEEDHPRKKRRANKSTRLSPKLHCADKEAQISCLQVLPFFMSTSGVSPEGLSDMLSDFIGLIGDKDGRTASWAMIACASSCFAKGSKSEDLAPLWKQIWQIAARSVSLPFTSRAACVLLSAMLDQALVRYDSISDEINSIVTTADINGPASLTDASLALMLRLVQLRNMELPNASQATSQQVVRWLFLRWNPGDLAFLTSASNCARPAGIVNLLRVCFGAKQLEISLSAHAPGGMLSEAWIAQAESAQMMDYLLLADARRQSPQPLEKVAVQQTDSATQATDSGDFHGIKRLVLELLYPKVEELLEACESWVQRGRNGGSGPSQERAQSIISLCIVGAILTPEFTEVNSRQSQDIGPALAKLIDTFLKVIVDSSDNAPLFETIYRQVRPHLSGFSTAELTTLCTENKPLLTLFATLSRAIRAQSSQESNGHVQGSMDPDDDFESQATHRSLKTKQTEIPRYELSLRLSQSAFYNDTEQRLRFLAVIDEDEGQVGLVPPQFIDELVALPDEEFLLCRLVLQDLLSEDLVISPDDALKVLGKVGNIISGNSYRCCEVVLSFCIDLIRHLSRVWSDERHEISSSVGDLYNYFVKVARPKNMLSPAAQIAMARLLLHLLKVNPGYGESLGMPTCRATLISIMEDGDMVVKHFIGSRLPDIFAFYVLKDHDSVFVEILNALPNNTMSKEGIAFRLYVFAELACRWPTLLRRCIYHIFETPGEAPDSVPYAKCCLEKTAAALNLKGPQDIFALFAPQVLYTWLESKEIGDIPFQIFGFQTLGELLAVGKSEASAILMMRGQDHALSTLVDALGVTTQELIKSSFSKILAYCIGHDISTPGAGGPSTGEARVRKVLGREAFAEAIYLNFVDIIAILFDVLDQESPIENAFAKEDSLKYAADIMAEIKKLGHSDVRLPPNQQPFFRGKYLVRELAHLCSRTHYEMSTLWTPTLVVYVARKLLSTVHPALGSLHACSVLRKVRVLVCLAGEQATTSYTVEMLLHSIRPYIVDSECADDALGLTQYLLSRGSRYLQQSPSFLAGFALSTLASLRVFLESSQSSTSLESQFRATMGKARQFHSWFSKYLAEYKSNAFKDPAQAEDFKSIIQSATFVRSSGNAEKGTHESTLLLEILRDQEREDHLLNESARELALGLLCGDFKIPSPPSLDAIDTDELAVTLGTAVWKSCRSHLLSKDYLAWAGRVVGRSFAASGAVHQDLLRESQMSTYLKLATDSNGSIHGILRHLELLTTHRDCATAGLAEAALRTVVSSIVGADEYLTQCTQQSLSDALFKTSNWGAYNIPPMDTPSAPHVDELALFGPEGIALPGWSQSMAAYLAGAVPATIILSVLPPILQAVERFAEQTFPFVVHLVLLSDWGSDRAVKKRLSGSLKHWLKSKGAGTVAAVNVKLLLNTILYLRSQEIPKESSLADRNRWLDIDFWDAAAAARDCGMFKSALLFAELAFSEDRKTSRRSGTARDLESSDLLLEIFENIDDPDAYYGLPQPASLGNVLARMEYEKDGSKSLAFRGAQYDTNLRRRNPNADADARSLVSALSTLGLSGLSQSLLQTHQRSDASSSSLETIFRTARRLEIWNIPAQSSTSDPAVTLYKAYQSVHQATDLSSVRIAVHRGLGNVMRNLATTSLTATKLRDHLGALAVLTEMDDVFNVLDLTELEAVFQRFQSRSRWMMSGRYDDVSQILSCRETTMSLASQQSRLQGIVRVSAHDARLVEIRSMLLSSGIFRFHQATQESLNLATSLTDLIGPSEGLGLTVDAAIKIETANALWDHGEMIPSIRMLQAIDKDSFLKKQSVPVSRSDLLSKIGHRVSVARLEKPDDIRKNYLETALKELKGKYAGKDAGTVFHQFAMFCDEQLQNPDGLEDLARLQSLQRRKSEEVAQLKELISHAKDSQVKKRYSIEFSKQKQWLDLDEQELRRLEHSRSEFVRLSLENYLLSLIASDEHNNDALRFTALWLERSAEDWINEAVRKYLDKVPTRKFAPLMNQLTSRLVDQQSSFQKLLFSLVLHICIDHPYHGMYQIWAGTRSRTNQRDEVAVLRQKATEKVSKQLATIPLVAPIWQAIDKTSRSFTTLAADRDDKQYKSGNKVDIKDSPAASTLAHSLAKYRIPPPTLQMELAADRDYSKVPVIVKLEPQMSIASGLSAPKIINAVGSDGKRYRMLVKGGNDDLRQDAIMEQVFSAVSNLLKLHRSAQQRNLGIRTYKVLPLTSSTGLIEFVQNTIPLHEFLMPAHERYHPKDLKGSQCRKEIHAVQNKSIETRIRVYQEVTRRFHPVMRYFFMEYFLDPDEWFAKRLAYTRTTAAISMLGHVLGLGDRHGHNILLDHRTGEVVHIDLGVAFEAGRILPVPEVVPFRLTRDIVDGMGITGTEGVFRRCCEFTLGALREETYSITTILDVLRYDPLYTWSINPVRLAKLRDARRDGTDDAPQAAGPAAAATDEHQETVVATATAVAGGRRGDVPAVGAAGGAGPNNLVNEPSEADRALEVVRKKLSKTLSVSATVNDLINQATDERNLAVLYSGWAAYA